MTLRSEIIEVDDSPEAVFALFCERQWCDGLPVIPPTAPRVEAMLKAVDGNPAESLGPVPPLWREATLEKLAVNAVMAGCLPEYFPAIIAGVEAMLDPAFNLFGIQATTHPVAPLLIVNGPHAKRLGMNAAAGLFGPGCRANATIGRAIRLILLNVGGAWPGRADMATQGNPAKYSYAIAEHEAANPWGPLHTELGYAEGESVVTVFGGEGPHNVNDHVSTGATGILNTVADSAATLGSNTGWLLDQSQLLLVLGPEHADTIFADGFSKEDVKRFVFEHARIPFGKLRLGAMWGMHHWPRWMNAVTDDRALLPVVDSPREVFVIVAGGAGKHSSVVPNCAFSRAVSRPITRG